MKMQNVKTKIKTGNLKKGIYRHYKGDLVEVLGVAVHSETLEEFALYRHVSGKRAGEKYYWIRPIKMFNEKIIKDNKTTPRFDRISTKLDKN